MTGKESCFILNIATDKRGEKHNYSNFAFSENLQNEQTRDWY